MLISLRWLNHYLSPGDITAEEAEHILTYAGFPIESAKKLPSGDTLLDVEVTSNRGDVLSHIGVAREVAAASKDKPRALKLPAPDEVFDRGTGVPPVSASTAAPSTASSVDNRVPESCPLFTARLITGVKVGPSPRWLIELLESVGQRSINNVVDVTNFVGFEYGQPSHVFDLATIPGGKLVVRAAAKGEKLKLLDDQTPPLDLRGDEIVVADATRPISLAGIMGGADTAVSERTTGVILEAATWDPPAIRRTARRYQLRTDASYRFERTVDPRTIEPAAQRLAALICKLTGGTLASGVINAGPPLKPLTTVHLRHARITHVLGEQVPMPEVQRILHAHDIAAKPEPIVHGSSSSGAAIACTIPAHRPDLEREIDLIEEVARTHGLDKLALHEQVDVRIAPPQPSEKAVQELGRILTGLGFYETVTFTFVSLRAAKPFVPAGMRTLQVHDERRKADPVLRPSAIPSLLACRRANQDRGVRPDGDMGFRLFELSAAFAEQPPEKPDAKVGRQLETLNLSLIADCASPVGAKSSEQKQAGVRLVRAAIESIARALGGEATRIEIVPSTKPTCLAYDASAFAEARINGERVGLVGLIAPNVQAEHGLETPVAAVELNLAALIALYPPKSLVQALPAFPSIERDLSLIVREETAWASIDQLVNSLRVPLLESWSFVGAYRGQQAGPGKKSVTLRMRFRDPARTLTHDEVSPQVNSIIAAARKDLGADVRTA